MVPTLAKLLPFAVGGAFLPTWTSRVILLLGTERPLTNATAYVAGNATWRLGLGFAAIFIASVAAPRSEPSEFAIPVAIAWLAASLLTVAGVWLLARKPGTGRARGLGWVDTLKRFPPWAAFAYGAYNCAVPGAQWAYFLGGCAVIASSGLAWAWQLTLLAAFVAVLELMLLTPVAIYVRKQDEARAIFGRIDGWLASHAPRVLGGILVMIGGLFAYVALVGGHIGGSR